jgi:hypothetical protein
MEKVTIIRKQPTVMKDIKLELPLSQILVGERVVYPSQTKLEMSDSVVMSVVKQVKRYLICKQCTDKQKIVHIRRIIHNIEQAAAGHEH